MSEVETFKAKLGQRGLVTIPHEVRDLHKWKPGATLEVTVREVPIPAEPRVRGTATF